MTKREKRYHQRKKGKKQFAETSMHWLCGCGHYEESGLHCSHCGAQPPWGCDCSFCNDYDDDYDDDDIIGYYCLGCGHQQDTDGECDICTGYCLEPIYF